ncbi:hypothetical protein FGG08_005343 [Glutinoglossum americanum]|uniref:S-adenosyl-L-methionine-dependent methyltransferase n=1 Tax=Glutinoglossum americanum TaxID=1670608 RepID=A0A9P8HYL9_9PEZI|nr:hypothetical protein FGG08_005343 [Glutinoglossum americanum]
MYGNGETMDPPSELPIYGPADELNPDSAFEEDSESFTSSLGPESYDFHFENGRRYHALHAGEYWGPNDERQIEAERITHRLYLLTLDGQLCAAPLAAPPHRVLDIGTGAGSWAIDFAAKHPSAAVLGTDLSPIQDLFIPSNLRFEIVDFCDMWSYSENSFDFVFLRGLDGCVRDWPRLYAEVYRALKPGAYIEHSEMCIELKSDDGAVAPEHIFGRWRKMLLEASDAYGKPLGIADQTKELSEAAGFVEVVEQRFKWPIGGWNQERKLKEIGRLNKKHWEQSIEGWCIALLTRALKWTVPQVRGFLREMEEGLRDSNIHAYHEVTVLYGRKRESGSETRSEESEF